MTRASALKEAVRRWGSRAYATVKVVSRSRCRWYCVGDRADKTTLRHGYSRDGWHGAFLDADRREGKP